MLMELTSLLLGLYLMEIGIIPGRKFNYRAKTDSCNSYDIAGTIDEVMIFNRTLSAAEIQSLYNASAYKYQNNFTNLSVGHILL